MYIVYDACAYYCSTWITDLYHLSFLKKKNSVKNKTHKKNKRDNNNSSIYFIEWHMSNSCFHFHTNLFECVLCEIDVTVCCAVTIWKFSMWSSIPTISSTIAHQLFVMHAITIPIWWVFTTCLIYYIHAKESRNQLTHMLSIL